MCTKEPNARNYKYFDDKLDMKNDKMKIVAVVVTYNRIELLKECISALKNQSYKEFDIVIVNNGSTDGTSDYLSSLQNVIVINQDNCGGAGGFYSGMKFMFDNGYDALWMMDDDGLPDRYQLEYLIKGSLLYSIDYANALVINKFDKSKTLFEFENTVYDNTLFDHMGVIQNAVLPFNGTFIWRYVIEKAGLIKKEMFIWGDEREYTERVRSLGFKVGTITQAIHYHPPFKGNWKKIFPLINHKRTLITIKPFPRDRIFYRNLGYLDAKYRQKNGLKYILYYCLRLKIKGLIYFLRYYKQGRKNNFSENLQ